MAENKQEVFEAMGVMLYYVGLNPEEFKPSCSARPYTTAYEYSFGCPFADGTPECKNFMEWEAKLRENKK